MMTEAIKGKTRSEIESLTQQFRDMMSLDWETEIELDPDRLAPSSAISSHFRASASIRFESSASAWLERPAGGVGKAG